MLEAFLLLHGDQYQEYILIHIHIQKKYVENIKSIQENDIYNI